MTKPFPLNKPKTPEPGEAKFRFHFQDALEMFRFVGPLVTISDPYLNWGDLADWAYLARREFGYELGLKLFLALFEHDCRMFNQERLASEYNRWSTGITGALGLANANEFARKHGWKGGWEGIVRTRETYREHESVEAAKDKGRSVPRLINVNFEKLAEQETPPREWIIKDVIPRGSVTLLGGDGGVGKSMLAKQLCVAMATGTAWLNQQVKKEAALFLSAEDDHDELWRRFSDICRHTGVNFADLAGDPYNAERPPLIARSLAGENAIFATPEGRSNVLKPTKFFEEIEEYLTKIAMPHRHPKLVVLNSLADFFGGNENDRSQARQFIGLLRGLCTIHKTTVVVLAHPSVQGKLTGTGLSGSTAWNASVRSRL